MNKVRLLSILGQYQTGKITLGKAAELAGYPLRTMLRLVVERKIPFQYSVENLKQDFTAAQK